MRREGASGNKKVRKHGHCELKISTSREDRKLS